MSEKANSSVNTTNPWTDQCITCPFDKTHRLLPLRLLAHLNRCALNHSGKKMVRCPFDISHVIAVSDLQDHVVSCGNRASLVRFQNPDKLPPGKEETPQVPIIESAENWDNEPDVPTYDPAAYCATNPVVRVLHGASAAARREFRELERKRFRSFQKESYNGSNV